MAQRSLFSFGAGSPFAATLETRLAGASCSIAPTQATTDAIAAEAKQAEAAGMAEGYLTWRVP